MRTLANISNVDVPDSDYVKGRIRDKNLGSGISGTPVIEAVYGDMVQFFQKLVSLSGVSENDLPDNETNGHQLIEALRVYLNNSEELLYKNPNIMLFGKEYSIVEGNVRVTQLNDTQIAWAGTTNSNLYVYEWDGVEWAQTGNIIQPDPAFGTMALTRLSDNLIAWIDGENQDLRTYSWDGSDFSLIGNQLDISSLFPGFGTSDISICLIDTNTIAVSSDHTHRIYTYEWDGADWAQVGNSYDTTVMDKGYLTRLDTNTVVFFENTNSQLITLQWDGADWAQVGNSYTFDPVATEYCFMSAFNSRELIFSHNIDARMYFFQWDGADWARVGYQYRIREGVASNTHGFPVQVLWGGQLFIYNPNDDEITNAIRVNGF